MPINLRSQVLTPLDLFCERPPTVPMLMPRRTCFQFRSRFWGFNQHFMAIIPRGISCGFGLKCNQHTTNKRVLGHLRQTHPHTHRHTHVLHPIVFFGIPTWVCGCVFRTNLLLCIIVYLPEILRGNFDRILPLDPQQPLILAAQSAVSCNLFNTNIVFQLFG